MNTFHSTQSANVTHFRAPKRAISYLVLFGLSPGNAEKISKASYYRFFAFKKNVVSSAYAVYRNKNIRAVDIFLLHDK